MMKAKKFTIAVFLVICGSGNIIAQTEKSVTSGSVNQDSVAFHAQMIQDGANVNMQTMTSSVSATNYSGTFTVGGNTSSYYPVVFDDSGWSSNEATVLHLGRSSTHWNNDYHGSMIALFRFHISHWGHGSHFIDADIKQYSHFGNVTHFVAGWQDVSWGVPNNIQIIIWLRGGSKYHWHSNYSQTPTFTNGSLTVGATTYPVKNEVDAYVNSFGPTFSNNIWVAGNKPNYFAGNVGIGTTNPTSKLTVAGDIRAREVKVEASAGADFVFAPDYRLRPLAEVEQFITANRHLPDIAPADSMIQNGVNMGEFQIQLLQKIEELTLYTIEQQKQIDAQSEQIRILMETVDKMKK